MALGIQTEIDGIQGKQFNPCNISPAKKKDKLNKNK